MLLRRKKLTRIGLLFLQQSNQTDIILGHHTIQHIIRALSIGHSHLVEFNQMLFDQTESREIQSGIKTQTLGTQRLYFSVLKKIAHPSTCRRSFSVIVFARDFGEKIPS